MKYPAFKIGDLVKDVDHLSQRTVVGFISGLKLSQRQDPITKGHVDIFVYEISGHKDSWYYEDRIQKVSQ